MACRVRPKKRKEVQKMSEEEEGSDTNETLEANRDKVRDFISKIGL